MDYVVPVADDETLNAAEATLMMSALFTLLSSIALLTTGF